MLDMESFIRNMPKVELHLHLEGTIEPGMLLQLAERNNVEFPYSNVEDVVAAQDYGEPALENFLEYHFNCQNIIRTETDLYDITLAFLERCKEENIRHVELMFDPQSHMDRGLSFDEIIRGIHRGRLEGLKRFGVSVCLIMCAMRDYSEERALELLELAKPYKDFITGIGLVSAEHGNPPKKHLKFFLKAHKQGYRLTAHCDCDQQESIENIAQCMDLLRVDRIDHGVNILDKNELVSNALNKGICFTMCPTWRPSDNKPRRLDRLRKMFDLGLLVTINTDDPAQFASGYLCNTLIEVQKNTPYTALEMVTFMRNAINGSWLENQEKASLLTELNNYALTHIVLNE